tara:strand:- start:1304 stop:1498 length:195 start_codon:yes stop_codon:yes gene_type:complete
MSNFVCDICGKICIDSRYGVGYITGCEHHPVDVKAIQEHQRYLVLDELTGQAQELDMGYGDNDV